MDRKCAEAHAKYYVYLIGNQELTCAYHQMETELPFISEVTYWCNYSWGEKIIPNVFLIITFLLMYCVLW